MTKSLILTQCGFFAAVLLSARTYEIGADQEFKTIKEVASKVQPGDQVLIHPGVYKEAVFWRGGSLSGEPIVVRGVGDTKPVIDGTGVSVLGASGIPRALFQVEGHNYIFENLELRNARNGQNGAGVRVVGANRTVFRHVLVRWNDMGFMSSGNDDLLVEHSEIAWNGTPEYNGFAHNFYLDGNRAIVRYCYIHNSTSGEVFKARTRYIELSYNYIADAHDRIEYGDTTKEVGFQEGPYTTAPDSHAVLIGNVIVKRGTGVAFLDFGPEGSTPARNGTLFMINNTVIREADVPHWFLRMGNSAEKAVLYNNIFYAKATKEFSRGTGGQNITGSNNWFPQGTMVPEGLANSSFGTDPGFVDLAHRDYRLRSDSPLLDAGTTDTFWLDENGAEKHELPDRTYLPHLQFGPRPFDGAPDLGAYELDPENRQDGGATLSGRLTLPDGQPLMRHVVVLQGPDPRSVITDERGVYQFLSVRSASATVRPWDADVPFETSNRLLESLVDSVTADFVSAPMYTIRGTITSRAKNEPIQGVLVYLNGRDSRWTITDKDGSFRFPLIPGGTANTLVLKHPALTFAPEDVNRVLGLLSGDLNLDVKGDLQYSITVSGRDPKNIGIIGVTLEFTGTGIAPRTVQTNTRGNWTFQGLFEGGDYEIKVRDSPDLYPQSTFTVKNLQKNETIVLLGPPILNLTGIVRYGNGQPIPGATVNVSGTQSYSARTDAEGKFLFNMLLQGGSYKFTASSTLAQFPSVAAEVASLSSSQTPVEITGTALYTITAQVVDANDAPVPRIAVNATGGVNRGFNTDTQGRAVFNSVPEGSRLTITPSNTLLVFDPPFAELTYVSGPQTIVFRSRPK